jgi:hypothetical protein
VIGEELGTSFSFACQSVQHLSALPRFDDRAQQRTGVGKSPTPASRPGTIR